jgi:hypothetical protein
MAALSCAAASEVACAGLTQKQEKRMQDNNKIREKADTRMGNLQKIYDAKFLAPYYENLKRRN